MNRQSNYSPAGYGDQYRRQWEAEEAARVAAREEIAENEARLRRERERKIEQERQAQLAADEAEFDRQIGPEKVKLRRQWLSDHPSNTAADFEAKAWPHLRANLRDEAKQALVAASREALLRTGRYSEF